MENKRVFIKKQFVCKSYVLYLSVNMIHENKYKHNKARFRVITFNAAFSNIKGEVEGRVFSPLADDNVIIKRTTQILSKTQAELIR